jgi:hypothetical protein
MASSICFYCGNSINRKHQTYVQALVQHQYKYGGTRESGRNFHLSCYDKFVDRGRPYNPQTSYVVLDSSVIGPEPLEEPLTA